MNTNWIAPVLVTLAVVLVVYFLVVSYNRLVRLRNAYKNAFAQIEVQIRRRHDLIPQLVDVAKGYMQHERSTLEAVISARNQAVQKAASADPSKPSTIKGLNAAEAGLSGVLGRLFALMEAYPNLKANETMLQLSDEWTVSENRIAYARQAFNETATVYNSECEVFPQLIVARMFSFQPATLFEITDAAEHATPRAVFT